MDTSDKTKKVHPIRCRESEKTKRVSFSEEAQNLVIKAQQHAAEGLKRYIEAGRLLCEAKERIKKKGLSWEKWFEERRNEGVFKITLRTAQNYMQLARKEFEVAEEESLRAAIESLKTPRRSEIVRKQSENLVARIVDELLDGWSYAEKLHLAEKLENSELNTQANYHAILKPAVERLREQIKEEIAAKGGKQ
jgi:hypothetical protein